jgi:ATP-dependent helicase/nuclease subunit A
MQNEINPNPLNLPPDFRERQRALDPTQSFICEAPAGSGKTELLTQRFLTLLSRVERPEEILAITFTRKATGEMRERILKALQDARLSIPEQSHKQTTWKLARAVIERDQEFQWKLLENPSRLRIQTFDSLCTSLTRQLPLESTLGAQPQIQEDAEELYRRAVRALLATLEDNTPWAKSLSELLGLLDNRFDRFENLMINMLARRETWLPLLVASHSTENIKQILQENFRSVIRERINAVREKIPAHLHREIITLASYSAANLRAENYRSVILNCLDMDLHFQQLPDDQPEHLSRWIGLAGLFVSFSGEWRKAASVRIGFPLGETRDEKQISIHRKQQWKDIIDVLSLREGMLDAFKNLRSLPRPTLDEEQWRILQALFEILPVLVAQLTLIFRAQNAIDFTELSLAARRALGDADAPSNLALRMDYQLKHILVDEFQDTSLSQVDLLNSLTQGWTPDDGRTLFCVGDAMQSIYAFRGANVGLFLHCREHGLANVQLENIQLQTNFRSQAGLVDWINRVFSSSFPQENDISSGAVKYSPAAAIHPKEEGKPVWLHAFVDQDNHYEEARYILGIIRKTKLDMPNASIAILVRSRDHASHILPLLKDNQIAYRAVDLEPLQNHAVIQDLLALTRALLHPADRTAWLAILRAPWCGLSLADLETIANIRAINSDESEKKLPLPVVLEQCLLAMELSAKEFHPTLTLPLTRGGNRPDVNSSISFTHNENENSVSEKANSNSPTDSANSTISPSPLPRGRLGGGDGLEPDLFMPHSIQIGNQQMSLLSDDGIKRLQRVLPILQSASAQRDRKTLRQWIQGCWLLLGGPAVVENETALNNADVYFDLLEKWEYASSLQSFEVLMRDVEKLYAKPDANADESLQIMTIHKSKGLEFDVVIVPALERKSRSNDSPVLLWQQRLNAQGDSELLMAPLTGNTTLKHPTYNHLRQEDSKKNQLENCRLLYVACTRARKKLYLSAQVKRDAEETARYKHPIRSSLLNSIWESVQSRMTAVENKQPFEPVTQEKTFKPRALYRLDSQWQQPVAPKGQLLADYIPQFDYQEDSNQITLQWQSNTARHTGTVVHRYLQAFAESGLQHWSENRIHQCQHKITNMLKTLGVGITEINTASQRVIKILCNVLNDAHAQKILATDYPFHANEYAVTLNTTSGALHLVMDRVYQDHSNHLWIIDYKTSEPAEGQSLENFYQQEVVTYQQKMSLYKMAMERLGYQQVKTALYFPVIGGWREIELVS